MLFHNVNDCLDAVCDIVRFRNDIVLENLPDVSGVIPSSSPGGTSGTCLFVAERNFCASKDAMWVVSKIRMHLASTWEANIEN